MKYISNLLESQEELPMLKQSQIINYVQLIRKIQTNKIKRNSSNKISEITSNIPKLKAPSPQRTKKENEKKREVVNLKNNLILTLKSPQNIHPSPRKKYKKINESLHWLKCKNNLKKIEWVENSNFKVSSQPTDFGVHTKSSEDTFRKTNAYELYCKEIYKKHREKEENMNQSKQENNRKNYYVSEFPRKKKPTKLHFSTEISNRELESERSKNRDKSQEIKMSRIYHRKIRTQENKSYELLNSASHLYDYLKLMMDDGEREKTISDKRINIEQKALHNSPKRVKLNKRQLPSNKYSYQKQLKMNARINKSEERCINAGGRSKGSCNFQLLKLQSGFQKLGKKYSEDLGINPLKKFKNHQVQRQLKRESQSIHGRNKQNQNMTINNNGIKCFDNQIFDKQFSSFLPLDFFYNFIFHILLIWQQILASNSLI